MRIEIVAVGDVETKKGPKSTYSLIDLTFKVDGKARNRKIMSFSNKEVFATVKAASPGEVYDVTTEKNGEYWDWTAMERVTAETAARPAATNSAGAASASARSGTWETPEERAKKQVYIVRQSSVGYAIEYLKATASDGFTQENVVDCAKYFEAYVFDTNLDADLPVQEVEDDIPF